MTTRTEALRAERERIDAELEAVAAQERAATRAAQNDDAMTRALRDPGFQAWKLEKLLEAEIDDAPPAPRRRR